MVRPKRTNQATEVTHPPEVTAEDLIWGINAVWEALSQPSGSTVSEILVQAGKAGPRLQQIIDAARERSVAVRFVEASRMRVPKSCRHQGVVARLSEAKLLDLEELLADMGEIRQGDAPKILVLDSIQDPRNLGSILRSALAAGFSRVIMTRERSVPVTGTVARTSAGAVAHMQICRVVNLADALNALKEKGFWIFGAVAEAGVTPIYSADFSGPIALVIGSEGKGIRPLVRRQCDHLVTIPMPGSFNSLNASVAAAVIMFEIARHAL
ncbi:MAG: 23S rRNA (guanosine(2251)-2'-O)-methyltransferase RlmB [Desulfobulbus sp.]